MDRNGQGGDQAIPLAKAELNEGLEETWRGQCRINTQLCCNASMEGVIRQSYYLVGSYGHLRMPVQDFTLQISARRQGVRELR